MEETRNEKNVKTSSAVWLGAANAGTGLLCAFAEGAAFQYLFVNKLGLDVKLNMVVWILFGIWNAVNDPIYGFLADRTKSKLGRRIPWIRYGSPILAVIYAVIWIVFPGTEGNQIFLFFQELIGLFLFDILYTAIASAIYVMPYEMAVTNKARNKIFLFNILFSLINFGAPMVLNSQLDKLIEYHADIFPLIMAAMGLVCGAVVFISTFFYKENNYVKQEEQPKFLEGLKLCLKNKSFLLYEVLSWTVIFAQSALMVGLTYVSGMWGYDNANNGWLGGTSIIVLYGMLALGVILGIIFFALMREKLGARNNTIIMTLVMGLGCIIGAFFGMNFIVCAFTFFCCGVGLAGGLYLVPMIGGDVMDKDEIDNDKRREGVYAGINSLITKPAGSIATALFPLMLTGIYGFNDQIKKEAVDDITGNLTQVIDYASQPQSAKDGLFLCWFLITGILLILSAVAMYFYPLYGKNWDKQKEELAKKHLEKEEAFLKELEEKAK